MLLGSIMVHAARVQVTLRTEAIRLSSMVSKLASIFHQQAGLQSGQSLYVCHWTSSTF